jgi:hypothetical protein
MHSTKYAQHKKTCTYVVSIFHKIIFFIVLLHNTAAYAQHTPHAQWLNDRRELSQMWEKALPATPSGLGPACNDRSAWSSPAIQERAKTIIARADSIVRQPFAPWNDEDYLLFTQKGSRAEGERMMNARRMWLYPVVVAECLTWNGKYLPYIEKGMRELIAQRSWIWPAHDRELKSFRGANHDVDLNGANLAHELAQASHMLGDRLPNELRSALLLEMRRRIFEPVLASADRASQDRASTRGNTWLWADHNWNAVCLKGVVSAALTVLPDVRERAQFAALGQWHSRYFISGFPDDGYSTEGAGYWNYGVGHFVQLRHMLMIHSRNSIDLFTGNFGPSSAPEFASRIQAIALYPQRIIMSPGNAAAFGDANAHFYADDLTYSYLAHSAPNWGVQARLAWRDLPVRSSPLLPWAPLPDAANLLWSEPILMANASKPPNVAALSVPSRSDFFNQAGVLTSRGTSVHHLSISIKAGGKGGGNGNHSHDDIGSYAIGISDQQPLGDVGLPRYSAKTFSKDRRTISSINSWGHPVPLVDGEKQKDAKLVSAPVLSISQTALKDEILIDMRDAYNVSVLNALTRRMVHQRASAPDGHNASVILEDRFEAKRPIEFEVALTTLGKEPQVLPDGSYQFESMPRGTTQAAQRVKVSIQTSAPWQWTQTLVEEEGIRFYRSAVRLQNKQANGSIKLIITPVP